MAAHQPPMEEIVTRTAGLKGSKYEATYKGSYFVIHSSGTGKQIMR
jgi:hypothetical protein